MKPLRPFFKYFGSKFRAAKMYPAPQYGTIIEPFAGSAGYSLNFHERDIRLFDADERVAQLWNYLITVSREEILRLPLLEYKQEISSLDIPDGAKLLLSCLVNTSPFRKCMSGWFGRPETGFWSERKRLSIASQVDSIRHWSAVVSDYREIPNIEATWFIDPPYFTKQGDYAHSKANPIDYSELADWCRSRNGQVIVCEQDGASWLPFRYLGQATAVRGTKKCMEAIWTND